MRLVLCSIASIRMWVHWALSMLSSRQRQRSVVFTILLPRYCKVLPMDWIYWATKILNSGMMAARQLMHRPQTAIRYLSSFLYLICCFWATMRATFGSKTKCWRNFLSTLTYILCRTALTSISFRGNPSRRPPIRLFGMTS